MGRLDGKVALITGGSGSIGSATARLFVAEGAKVVIADLHEQPLQELAAELGDASVYAVTDVTDSAQVEAAVRLAVDRFGALHIAFANAGIFGAHAEVADFPEDVFDRVLAVNVRGAFLTAKHALRAMEDGGSLIITSSVVGVTSAPNIVAYATSKHAVVGLMRTAAHEVAPRRIRVNTIHPGPVDNAFQHTIEVNATGAPEDEATAIFDQLMPLRRHASPDEIARTVLHLASDDSTFTTGTTVVVDGGLSI
jgi:NAD(P)-dependent dehydrogenase (short-subunit alcohol dehydrogenase family)